MNAGYVRLSRDDEKRNYISIEHQKLIIRQFAAERNMHIDRWYEDDGVSGYLFDRPGFNQLIKDIDKDIDRVFVKDFSRLGRHNAKVLLLLDDLKEHGTQLLVIDDNYDSMHADDDTIGIRTWYNERYVKDTSKKIKRALHARQKEGTLLTQPPFGYIRKETGKSELSIAPKEAAYVKMIFQLYLEGAGYRTIAGYLTEQNIPTPSMVRYARELEKGKLTSRPVAAEWSESMVKEILGNDFYTGTLRLHKRTRPTVHGKDKRVPKDDQYIFENNHPAIIDKAFFDQIQDRKRKRTSNSRRTSSGQWAGSAISNPFAGCLFCKDCSHRLTPVKRISRGKERKYYICSTYNTKGKRYCSKAHLIEENDLVKDILAYFHLCRPLLYDAVCRFNWNTDGNEKANIEKQRCKIQKSMENKKKQLKIILSQKVADLSNAGSQKEIVAEAYDALQQNIITQMESLKSQLQKLQSASPQAADMAKTLPTAQQIINQIMEKGIRDCNALEILIDRIEVDADGFPEIKLKYNLSGLLPYPPMQQLNVHENEIIYEAIRLIFEEKRPYTSANYLAKALTSLGYPKSVKSVLPYIHLFINAGILKPRGHASQLYTINQTKEELKITMQTFKQQHLQTE